MDELNINSILSVDEVDNLFSDNEETQDTPPAKEGEREIETTEVVEQVNVDSLFTDEPESVGGDEDKDQEKGDKPKSVKDGSSPNSNFYSSIASALRDEGILPDLDDTSKIKTPEDFAEAIENQIKSKFDERQKRIDEALVAGVEPDEIRQYENTISYLESIKDESISDETDKGEKLRKQLIYQDFVNRGYSEERAKREVLKSFNAGSDIEDAKEALAANKQHYQSGYDSLINDAKEDAKAEETRRKEEALMLKKTILEDNKVFGDLQVDKSTRQKVYDSISKPVYKDPDTGELLTTIQKYEKDNRIDFLKNVGLLFTLTDGFKNLDGLVKGKVKKEVKNSLKELEHTLNNTARTSDGNLKFASTINDDPEAFIGKGWDIDA